MKTNRTRLEKKFVKVLIYKVGSRRILFFDNELEVKMKKEQELQESERIKKLFSI